MSTSGIKIGDRISGRYELVRKIGAGGGGTVYEATHIGLDRQVALKTLKEPAFDGEEFSKRFSREAKVMSRLDHPNAVRVFDFGEHEGTLFIVMELLEGKPLLDETNEGRLEMERAMGIVAQLCDVLTVTHDMNLIHRDIKPENVFLVEEEAGTRAKLVDFGLAFISDDEDLSRMTQEGMVSGTPQYLSPEQALGSTDIGAESDIYSLGCMFYEMLTGHRPFEGKTMIMLLNAHLYVPTTSLRVKAPEAEIPAALDSLVLSMMAKEAADRPTAVGVATFLRRMLASDDVRGRGRPSTLLEPRAGRAVTASHLAAASREPDKETSTDSGLRLGVIGEISPDLIAAARSSGWRVEPFDGACDVLVVCNREAITAELAEAHPIVAVLESDSVTSAVELLKLGVEDVLDVYSADEIIRKVARVHRSRSRRNPS